MGPAPLLKRMIKKWLHRVKDIPDPSRGLLSYKEKNLKRGKEITSSLSDSARFNVASAVLPQTAPGPWKGNGNAESEAGFLSCLVIP